MLQLLESADRALQADKAMGDTHIGVHPATAPVWRLRGTRPRRSLLAFCRAATEGTLTAEAPAGYESLGFRIAG